MVISTPITPGKPRVKKGQKRVRKRGQNGSKMCQIRGQVWMTWFSKVIRKAIHSSDSMGANLV